MTDDASGKGRDDRQGAARPDKTIEDGATPAGSGDGSGRSPLIGRVIDDRFKLRMVLGEGGMGSVFLAEDQKLSGRRVALKLMSPRLTADPEFRARFEREAVLQANLPHPQIIQIQDMGESADGAYIVMEYSDGRSLSRLIRELGPRGPESALGLAEQILEVLDFAHGQGVIHRDLKPSNILVEERPGKEVVRLLDFGIAKLLGDPGQSHGQALTKTGFAYGTLGYMAPEQARGESEKIDHRADLYSVGIILYEMLTGEVPAPPESRGHPVRYAMWCQENSIAPLAESHPDLGLAEQVDEILGRALKRDPAKRYPSALAFLRDIREFREHASARTVARRVRVPATTEDTKAEVITDDDRRGRSGGVLGWVFSLVLLAALAYGYTLWKDADDRARRAEAELAGIDQVKEARDAAVRRAADAESKEREARGTLETERKLWTTERSDLLGKVRNAENDKASAEQGERMAREAQKQTQTLLDDANRKIGEQAQAIGAQKALVREKEVEIARLEKQIKDGLGDAALKQELELARAAKERLEKQVASLQTRPTEEAYGQLEAAKQRAEEERREAVRTSNDALQRASKAEGDRAAAVQAYDVVRRWLMDNASVLRQAVGPGRWPPPGITDVAPTPVASDGKPVVENGGRDQIFVKSVKARGPSGERDVMRKGAEVLFPGKELQLAPLPVGTTVVVVVYDGQYNKDSRKYRRRNLTRTFQVKPGMTKFSVPSR